MEKLGVETATITLQRFMQMEKDSSLLRQADNRMSRVFSAVYGEKPIHLCKGYEYAFEEMLDEIRTKFDTK